MKSIKDIKIEDVQDLFDSIIFLRGEEYFETGCVRSIEPIDSATIAGVVRGNQSYNVSATIGAEGDILCECSCPCDFNCKHAAALLLKWLSIKDKYNKELKEVKLQKKKSIKDILNKKSKEELVELLNEFINKHSELKSLIRIERKEIVSKIRNLFSDFWDWDEVKDLISQLETILDGIKRNKSLWDKELLNEMEICSNIMIKEYENVHDEGDLGIFFEDWFLLYGEIFSSIKPMKEEKKRFLEKIMEWVKNDDYGFDSSFEKALIGMCTSEEDIKLIKEFYKPEESKDEEYYEDEGDYYKQFYMELYNKIGMDEKYIEIAKESGFTFDLIDKLIFLNRLNEALEICEKNEGKESLEKIENKKIEILRKLGRKAEVKKILLNLVKKTWDFNYAIKLKKESREEEWQNYIKQVISEAKKKSKSSFLSRVYYNENDFKSAYEYSGSMRDDNYLELLAKKLSSEYPLLACNLFKKLCFNWINAGSGWPYKKAGKMLEAIKKLDKKGDFFKKTKEEVIMEHKKKYSLMEIIGKV